MTETAERTLLNVQTGGGITIKLRAREARHEGPIALLLHGLGVGSGYWDLPVPEYNTMDYLASQGITAYAMDHRGYGGSSPVPGESVTVANAREDVQAVLDFLGERRGGRRIALVGHSWGGMVAAAVAADEPERISCLVTIGTPFRRLHPAFAELVPALRDATGSVDGWLPNQTHLGLDQFIFSYDEEVLRAYQQLVESDYPRIPLGILDDCATLPHAWTVEHLHLPTLLICGTMELVVDRADCLETLDALPAAEKDLLAVGNSGHLMGLEKLSHLHVDRAVAGWTLGARQRKGQLKARKLGLLHHQNPFRSGSNLPSVMQGDRSAEIPFRLRYKWEPRTSLRLAEQAQGGEMVRERLRTTEGTRARQKLEREWRFRLE